MAWKQKKEEAESPKGQEAQMPKGQEAKRPDRQRGEGQKGHSFNQQKNLIFLRPRSKATEGTTPEAGQKTQGMIAKTRAEHVWFMTLRRGNEAQPKGDSVPQQRVPSK